MIAEPGFWFLIVMLVVTASSAVGALWARADYERLAVLALTIADDDKLSAEDQRGAGELLDLATARLLAPIMLIAVPVFSLYLTVRLVGLAVIRKPITIDSLIPNRVQSSTFSKITGVVIWKANPILILWGSVFAIPPLIVATIAGAGSVLGSLLKEFPAALAALRH